MAIKEMKLIELGALVAKMEIGDVIDFRSGTIYEDRMIGDWCGVKRIDDFENDNPMYIVSKYGGEAEAYLYHLSEYDLRIGNFCEPRLTYRLDHANRRETDYIECCAKMIADYLEHWDTGVHEIMTVEY